MNPIRARIGDMIWSLAQAAIADPSRSPAIVKANPKIEGVPLVSDSHASGLAPDRIRGVSEEDDQYLLTGESDCLYVAWPATVLSTALLSTRMRSVAR
ncbi:MAG: hypothetical protein SGI92_12140 [Bryobacteraceae bacterium]|nr:hypothetical protein [Bryobacteraceae bacterium]